MDIFFDSIILRSGLSLMTSFLFSMLLFPYTINKLASLQNGGQPIRKNGPSSHISKAGTPTMGGILILASIIFSSLIWADLSNYYLLIAIFVMLSMGVLGFLDDYRKIQHKNSKGVPPRIKLIWQACTALIASLFIMFAMPEHIKTSIFIPFIGIDGLNLGMVLYIIFTFFVITGSSNAVNLTDGLDGLATVPIMTTTSCLALISYITGNVLFSDYLHIQYIPGTEELFIYCGGIIGACIAFLWYNASPAKVFMGDVGSLALGGTIGAIALMIKQEVLFCIASAVFVMETISVMIQVIYYKKTKKRFFRMAPIHHHFEEIGWSENLIVIRFWIISVFAASIAMMVLRVGY